jgi:hypothetical protein
MAYMSPLCGLCPLDIAVLAVCEKTSGNTVRTIFHHVLGVCNAVEYGQFYTNTITRLRDSGLVTLSPRTHMHNVNVKLTAEGMRLLNYLNSPITPHDDPDSPLWSETYRWQCVVAMHVFSSRRGKQTREMSRYVMSMRDDAFLTPLIRHGLIESCGAPKRGHQYKTASGAMSSYRVRYGRFLLMAEMRLPTPYFAAIRIQRAWRRCVADPAYVVCNRRLRREWSAMADA